MPVSIVDGTVEEADLKWSRRGISLFKTIRFRAADGSARTVNKAVVKQEVADQLTAGAQGRFYLFDAFDIRGVHGVRLPDGRAIYAFPGNNEKIFLIAGPIAALWVVFMVVAEGRIPFLGVAGAILSAVGWYLVHKGKQEAKSQFEADNG